MTTRVIYQKLFNPQLMGTAPQLIYQLASSPQSLELRGARLRFVNTSGSTITFTAYAVPNGSTPQTINEFAANISILTGQFYDIDVPVLSIGDAIWAQSNTGSVCVCQFLNGLLIQ